LSLNDEHRVNQTSARYLAAILDAELNYRLQPE
jgi:hypothetical protein